MRKYSAQVTNSRSERLGCRCIWPIFCMTLSSVPIRSLFNSSHCQLVMVSKGALVSRCALNDAISKPIAASYYPAWASGTLALSNINFLNFNFFGEPKSWWLWVMDHWSSLEFQLLWHRAPVGTMVARRPSSSFLAPLKQAWSKDRRLSWY